MGSVIKAGSPISQVLASVVLAALTASLTTEQFETWGWRIPFLASLVIVAWALFIRLRLEDTPAFKATQAEEDEAAFVPAERRGYRALRGHLREITWLTLAWSGTSLSFYLVTVFGVTFLSGQLGVPQSATFTIIAVANGVSVIACIAGGVVSDRIGRKTVSYIGLAGTFVGVGIFFAVPNLNVVSLGFVVTLALCSIQFLSGAWPAFFAEQLPTEVRYSGGALALTIPNLVLSATAPFVATSLVSIGAPALIAVFALMVILVSAFAFSRLPERRGVKLENVTAQAATLERPTETSPPLKH
jgi:MFS family permease